MQKRRPYRIVKGSVTERIHASRAKVRLLAGGFGNGKTTAACIIALQIAKDYPGANICLARATYPKLNSTLRREFFKWMPAHWKASFDKRDNDLLLKNGTTVNFRYVSQQGKHAEDTTSNLLSANYDFIVVDQCEDPEITHKDLLDLLGRLRGNTEYQGNDPTMPRTGPRMLVLTCNPTRNWVYRKLAKPWHDLQKGVVNLDLMCLREGGQYGSGKIKLDEHGKPMPIIEVFESSTYDNADNLESDYIQTLEAAYSGEMRDRFLMGKWVAYEGLIYPKFDIATHVLAHEVIVKYYNQLRREHTVPHIREGYDDGIAVQSCYIFAFEDAHGNVMFMDGIYKAGASPEEIADGIHSIRTTYSAQPQPFEDELIVHADPAIFRRTRGGKAVIGQTVAEIYDAQGIRMRRGNNDVMNGIIKMRAYVEPLKFHRHPITGNYGAPRLFISDKLAWFADEISGYFWKKDTSGQPLDEPRDGNDHAMDTSRYILTEAPTLPAVVLPQSPLPVYLRGWGERDVESIQNIRSHRHYAAGMN